MKGSDPLVPVYHGSTDHFRQPFCKTRCSPSCFQKNLSGVNASDTGCCKGVPDCGGHLKGVIRIHQAQMFSVLQHIHSPPPPCPGYHHGGPAHHGLHGNTLTGGLGTLLERHDHAGRLLIEGQQLFYRDMLSLTGNTVPVNIFGKIPRSFLPGQDMKLLIRHECRHPQHEVVVTAPVIPNREYAMPNRLNPGRNPECIIHPETAVFKPEPIGRKTSPDLLFLGACKKHSVHATEQG